MANYFFFFLFVIKQLVLQSYWSLEGVLDTAPLFRRTCPLLFPKVTVFLGSLLDGLYASGQKFSEFDDDEELDEEEVERRGGYGEWTLRTILGERDETLLGGCGGARCEGGVRLFGRFAGDEVWLLLATSP